MSISQFIISVLTIAMSGVIATAVTYFLNTRRDERRFRRQRLEETFVAFRAFCNLLGVLWVGLTNVMTGKLDYNQALDLEIARGKDEAGSFAKLEMLITLYYPEFTKLFDRLLDLRSRGNEVLGTHKRRYLAGHVVDKESLDALCTVIKSLEDLEKEFAIAARGAVKPLLGAG